MGIRTRTTTVSRGNQSFSVGMIKMDLSQVVDVVRAKRWSYASSGRLLCALCRCLKQLCRCLKHQTFLGFIDAQYGCDVTSFGPCMHAIASLTIGSRNVFSTVK